MFDHSTCGDWNTSLVEEETLSECLKGQERWNISKPLRKGPLWGFTFLNTALSFCVLTSSQRRQETVGALFFSESSWFHFQPVFGMMIPTIPHNLKRWMPSCMLAYSIPYHINELYIYISQMIDECITYISFSIHQYPIDFIMVLPPHRSQWLVPRMWRGKPWPLRRKRPTVGSVLKVWQRCGRNRLVARGKSHGEKMTGRRIETMFEFVNSVCIFLCFFLMYHVNMGLFKVSFFSESTYP